MKIIIKEVGLWPSTSFPGTYDTEDDDRETRSPNSMVIGKRDDGCEEKNKKGIRIKIIPNETP